MNSLQATLAIVVCHILTGHASVITRYLVFELEAVEIAFLRYLFGGLFILPLVYFSSRNITRHDLWKTILLGALFFGLFPYLFSLAFVYTTAARGALVLATMPLWTMLLSSLFRHEKISTQAIFGISLTILGIAVAVQDELSDNIGGESSYIGEGIMLLAAFIGGVYSLFAKKTLNVVPVNLFTTIAMLSGAFLLLPWAQQADIGTNFFMLSTNSMYLMLYLACISGGLAFYLMNWAINKASPIIVTMFVTVHPLSAMLTARIFLAQELSINYFIGAGIVFFGLLVSQLKLRAR